MGIGYLLGGIACIIYMLGVGYAGIKKTPWVLKMVKMKLGKNMTDEKAAAICKVFAVIVGVVGVFLLIFGAIQG